MRRRLTVLFLAGLGVLGAVAPSALGSVSSDKASCMAGISTVEPGIRGSDISTGAKENQPLGINNVRPQAREHVNCH